MFIIAAKAKELEFTRKRNVGTVEASVAEDATV
jgi:hypothetical protein